MHGGGDETSLTIPDVKLIRLKKFRDERGTFCELYREPAIAGIKFVQDNLAVSTHAGTIRGLHYQEPPYAQTKLFTVIAGAIFDVAVDLRRGSPHFGRWVAAEFSAEDPCQLLIPRGFAHGYCTLEPDTVVLYKVDAHYSAAHDRGIVWNDATLGITWPVAPEAAILSEKDRQLPTFAAIDTPFSL
ncbi:MAG TPA: dTDP-4-dehydrorhamnose 3,5-epimerase [Stellaceae bacterium]|nr:dTDP-4-dehydrorhamnose 3,5-epimerase [Stellaceae bacterium]